MKKVYFVRHGETEANADSVSHGPKELLNEKGRVQAKTVAQRFETIPVDVLISSPYPRALSTAQEIAQTTKKEIIQSDLFIERVFPSETVDKSYADPQSVLIKAQMAANVHDPKWHYSDEENFFDLQERAKKAIAFLEDRPEENIAVVSHGMFIRFMMATMLDPHMDPVLFQKWNLFFKTINTGITYCRKDRDDSQYTGWRLLSWNDHAHLGELK